MSPLRVPVVAGNWKMNGTSRACSELARSVRAAVDYGLVEVIVCPPYPALAAVDDEFRGSELRIAAQNMLWAESGAYTGEVAPAMVAEFASLVLVAHSERRRLFAESDDDANRKVHAAFDHSLTPVLCVGETAGERDSGQTDSIVAGQVERGSEGIRDAESARLIVAYEPVWAIGTGRACEPDEAQRVAALIRARLAGTFGDAAERTRILYGGSVTAANAAAYFAGADIDGALVGGASLNAIEFGAIVRAAASRRSEGEATLT